MVPDRWGGDEDDDDVGKYMRSSSTLLLLSSASMIDFRDAVQRDQHSSELRAVMESPTRPSKLPSKVFRAKS